MEYLKASLLIALYSVRSDRMLCEMLDYNILFRWFLDMSLEERGRLVKTDIACRFFDAVVNEARRRKLLSDEHSSVDGTLIEAWASTAKSLRGKDGSGGDGGPDDQGMVTSAASAARTKRTNRRPTRCQAQEEGQGSRDQA